MMRGDIEMVRDAINEVLRDIFIIMGQILKQITVVLQYNNLFLQKIL